ncbi:YIP1 family protein [Defluviimonas sp. WL0050]|uniref:YIP1 family protein n=1 Tax=Albidovulum litorale TaxID=2984134 RepID=A0ABT2ZQQ8_9RHOB|nr:Yip1 family protein [Defluviimonas sp. WL0050]MCV2873076.1 YIP1 family protein [Defluviimonas sp. WL0050]
MTGLPALVTDLVMETLRSPREAARRIIALDPPMEARWIGLLLVSVLALLETRLGGLVLPLDDQPPIFALAADPVLGVPFQVLSQLVIATAIAWIGRIFGGTGSFADALLLIVWLEFMLVLAQAVQLVALVLVPPVGMLIAFVAIGLLIWLLVQFTAALHGFTNLALVVLGMVVSFLVIITILSMVLIMFGVAPPVEKG